MHALLVMTAHQRPLLAQHALTVNTTCLELHVPTVLPETIAHQRRLRHQVHARQTLTD